MNGNNFAGGEPSAQHQNAVSVYQNDALDDFPVLKAFQQYIDAEQAKAHKRMAMLCIFFVIMLISVIGVFVLLLTSLSSRNDQLNSKLFDYIIKDRERQSESANAPAYNAQMMKSITDSMATFQQQLSEQQTKMSEQQSRILEQQSQVLEESKKMSDAAAARKEDLSIAKKNKVEEQSLQMARASLESERRRIDSERERLNSERERLAGEKERLRKKELDLYRREYYPETRKQAVSTPTNPADDDDIADILNMEIDSGDAPSLTPGPVENSAKAPSALPAAQPKQSAQPNLPAEKRATSGWVFPVE